MSYSFQTIDNSADLTFNQLLGINNAGTIAGYFGNGTIKPNKGYTVTPPYAQSNFTNENFPNSVQTQVTGLNDLGVTVGFWSDQAAGTLPGVNNFGWSSVNGVFTNVVGPDTGNATPSVTQLLGVNDAGIAVGFDTSPSGVNHGFTYNTNTKAFTPVLGPNGADNVTATGINNGGTISGFFINGVTIEGFIETPTGQFTVLTGPQPGQDGAIEALGLNDEGQVVGSFNDKSGTHGFVYDVATGTYTVLNTGNNTMTVANGINDLGQVVGFDQNASAPGTDGSHTDGFLASIPGTVATLTPTAGTTIEVPAGYGGVTLSGTTDATLQDFLAGHAVLRANAGNDTLITAVGADTLIGGAGADTLNGANGTNTTFFDGGGNASITGGNGNDIIVGTTGNDTITTGTGSNFVAPGTGNDLIGAHGALDVIFPGGSDTIAAFGKVVTAVGTGTLAFLNGANQATVLGGNTGNDLISGGPGGGLFAGGDGGGTNVIFGGTGVSTIFGSTGKDLLAAGGANPDLLIAGSGNETLTGVGSTGNNTFYAGAGNDLLGGGAGNETFFAGKGSATVIGGSGANLYGFINGLAGGAEVIFGFSTAKGDKISLQNYGANAVQNALATQQNIAGGTILKLSDNTQITFVGVASLNASAFT